MKLGGWGNYPVVDCKVFDGRTSAETAGVLEQAETVIPRGNGRAYGDAAFHADGTLRTRRMNRILAFNEDTGEITCESGVLLSDLLDVFVSRGWFPPVTPGTKLVTIGGMIASDVHGKNHHVSGTFGNHVMSLELMQADGSVITCSRTENADLLRATCGGMGLTGVILNATFRLEKIETAWIRQETLRCANLKEVMAAFEDSDSWTYSVAWIDCLAKGSAAGRSLLFRGEHATTDELPAAQRAQPLLCKPRRKLKVPFALPNYALNSLTVRAFNEIYFRCGTPGTTIVDYDVFFYPLDSVLDWNRIYGSKGFTQFQCVLPLDVSAKGLDKILSVIADAGMGSFLAVLKLFGPGDSGMLSFPMEGYTLAMDIPVRPKLFDLMPKLDAIVRDFGGRIYLAKDVMQQIDTLTSGYPELEAFQAVRQQSGTSEKFVSQMSQRLEL